MVMIAQPCAYTKNHCVIPFQWVNFMTHELYVSEKKEEMGISFKSFQI